MEMLRKIGKLFGIDRHSKYVNNYIREANIRSGIYMASVIAVIELWMIIRSLIKNIIPAFDGSEPFIKLLFKGTSLYWLMMIMGIAMMIYCFTYDNKTMKKETKLILNMVFSTLLLVFSFFIIFEIDFGQFVKDKRELRYYITNSLLIMFYAFNFILSIVIMVDSLLAYFSIGHSKVLSTVIVSLFAVITLIFGTRVSYLDFYSSKRKMIVCFLMVSIYVGCLLIYRPYISVGVLFSIFIAFVWLLHSQDSIEGKRQLEEGDLINSITFFISLAMVAISIYNQRVNEAKKDEELERLAKEDDLTSLYNFDYFTKLSKEILLNARPGEYIFLFFNIENFKSYNDLKSFDEGNVLLRKIANLIISNFEKDIVARQADDHYVVLTKEKEETIIEKAHAIQDGINMMTEDVYLVLKVGSRVVNDLSEDPRHSMDKARYAATTIKNKANLIYLEYDKRMDEEFHRIQYVLNNIDNAVNNGWIKAYYQPVVWADNMELCGCEALARWIDPEYGFLNPGEFIPILEQYRLIDKLDLAIYKCVCENIRYCLDNDIPIVPISLNFSRLDFELMDAVGEFERLVEEYNVPKELLHVEITESALTDDDGKLERSINKIHDDGFALWLDDFGSGYSSLNVLKDYNFDVIKLDMKFLSGFDSNEKTKVIIDSVISMARRVGMLTLTEGVETMNEAEFLKDAGCGRLQGYLISKPIPYDEILKKIEEGQYKVSNKTI